MRKQKRYALIAFACYANTRSIEINLNLIR